MRDSGFCEFDRIVFDSGSVRVGAFRCHPDQPSFHDSGPARTCCFVFPRTAVEIQHERERAFVANPNVVTFYNQGQAYLRKPISADGDRCDWFSVDLEIVQDVVRSFDPALDARPDQPFRFTRGWSDASTYLLQRRVFEHVASHRPHESLGVEELVVSLLERVVQTVYRTAPLLQPQALGRKQRDIVHHVELLLSERWGECLALRDIADEVNMSVYHLCRTFRRATGTTLHQYRQNLRVRGSLEPVIESRRRLVDIALDAGFSSHSHFTSAFHREFARTPSMLRTQSSRYLDA